MKRAHYISEYRDLWTLALIAGQDLCHPDILNRNIFFI